MAKTHKMVFKHLKEKGASTLPEIASGLGKSEKEIKEAIEPYLKFLKYDEQTKKYSVKFKLDKPLQRNHNDRYQAMDYSAIKAAMAGKHKNKKPATETIPQKYENPYLKYLPKAIDQGSRGTCVGFGTAIACTLAYFADTQDFPSDAEIAAEQRNVKVDFGCTNGNPAIFDIFEKRWKSPEYLYVQSRLVGHITVPEGSDVGASAKSLAIYGSVLESDDKTSKSEYCVPDWYPTSPEKTPHKLNRAFFSMVQPVKYPDMQPLITSKTFAKPFTRMDTL